MVPLRTMDEILAGRSPIMMKLDVEGFEEQAIAGASGVLNNPSLQALLLEGVTGRCKLALESAGFVRKDYDPWLRQIIVNSEKRNLGNELWLRDPQSV